MKKDEKLIADLGLALENLGQKIKGTQDPRLIQIGNEMSVLGRKIGSKSPIFSEHAPIKNSDDLEATILSLVDIGLTASQTSLAQANPATPKGAEPSLAEQQMQAYHEARKNGANNQDGGDNQSKGGAAVEDKPQTAADDAKPTNEATPKEGQGANLSDEAEDALAAETKVLLDALLQQPDLEAAKKYLADNKVMAPVLRAAALYKGLNPSQSTTKAQLIDMILFSIFQPTV